MKKTPLNQIYYGAPGTGKTHYSIKDALDIINENSKGGTIDEFSRLVAFIRTTFNEKIYNVTNGKTFYRNGWRTLKYWGMLLNGEFPEPNSFNCKRSEEILSKANSGWSQDLKYFTNFGLCRGNWKENYSGDLGDEIYLSENGIKLKDELTSWLLNKPEINAEKLIQSEKNGAVDMPEFIWNYYCNSIIDINDILEFSSFKKSLICSMYAAYNNEFIKFSDKDRSSEYAKNFALKYYDVNSSTNIDFGWTQWHATFLEDLGIFTNITNNDKTFYILTKKGEDLLKRLIQNWKNKYPNIFAAKIDYESANSLGYIKFVTFHQSFSYEEFIESIRPVLNTSEEVSFQLKDGIFKYFVKSAKTNLKQNYVLIIDEINRGNISKIFGELITLIEETKREGNVNAPIAYLPYSNEAFSIPSNIFIIGTMNSSDKSIVSVDHALRRRFSFKEFRPSIELLKDQFVLHPDGTKIYLDNILEILNSRIEILLDSDHKVGHSYFMSKGEAIKTWGELCDRFVNQVIPLLLEYFRNDYNKLQLILGDDLSGKSDADRFFIKNNHAVKEYFKIDSLSEYGEEFPVFIQNRSLTTYNYNDLSSNLFTKSFEKSSS